MSDQSQTESQFMLKLNNVPANTTLSALQTQISGETMNLRRNKILIIYIVPELPKNEKIKKQTRNERKQKK